VILRRFGTGTLAAPLLLSLGACTDAIPTSADPALSPVDAVTVEIRLPFETFARDLRVDRGFGAVPDLGVMILANEEADGLTARPMIRFGTFPALVLVPPPDGGATLPDSNYVAEGGLLTVFFDTLTADQDVVYEVEASAVQEPWHPRSASWRLGVDTLGSQIPWSRPGGGEVRPFASGEWLPFEGDSLVLEVDSLTVNEWMDTTNVARGLQLRLGSPGERVRLRNATLTVLARSEINADTLLRAPAASVESTFLYAPEPDFPPDVLPVGGTPSHRVSFRFALPDSVEASGEACPGGGTCLLPLEPDRVVFGGLLLRTVATDPPALAPADSVSLDLRPALAPDRLPRSPLGGRIAAQGKRVPSGAFGGEAGSAVEIGLTRYLRDVIRGEDARGDPVPSTVTLLTSIEPQSIGIATFAGPGREGAPVLRIILTLTDGVKLP
jgi:hypothetical protein